MPALSQDPEFMMPASAESAAMRFVVEAMRQQTEILKGLRGEMKEKHALLHDVHDRVIRIEATVTEARIERLEKDVDSLKSDRDRRDGASGVMLTILKSPALGWLAGLAIAAWVYLTGKAS